jgi:uncharacterized protein (DUF58 family)
MAIAFLNARIGSRAMWKSFLCALGLLTIALIAALYSASASMSGHGGLAGVLAFLSLILALWVGVRYVPRLARNVDWNWMPFLTSYKVTKDGWIFFVTVLIVIFAALNTSNNLLYMVLSAMLAVLLLSGLISALNFSNLKVRLVLPQRCYAEELFEYSFRVLNHRRLLPMFSLRMQPLPGDALQFESLYFDSVEPRSTESHTSEIALARRGRYTVREVQGLSRFPFGLLSKEHTYLVDAEIICYPKILARESLIFSSLDIQGNLQSLNRGSGNELYRIRDYLYSDGARHVHWKASAKTAVLKTREYAADESLCVVLELDRFGTEADADRFENLVSQAASLAFYLIRDGADVSLVTDEWRSPGSSYGLLDSIMEYLATVERSPSAPLPELEPGKGALLLSLRQRHG